MATPAPDGFSVKPVQNRTAGALDGHRTLGLVLHEQNGNGALAGWFNNPAAQASSTWWAGKKGEREQYGDPDTDKFWAQAAGNSMYHSIETEGYPNEPLTDAQIETVAQAFAWGHLRYDWPLVLAEAPGQPGLGWHGMGGVAWGNHPGCPGDIRKGQRAQILVRAKQIAGLGPQKEWWEMPIPAADLEQIVTAVWTHASPGKPTIWMTVVTAAAKVDALTAAVQALSDARGADGAAITKAVVDKINALQLDVVVK